MARARYLVQWFPTIIEEELDEIKLKKSLSEREQDELAMELGVSLFGSEFNIYGDNAELPSIMAGQLGSKVKEYKNVLEDEIILKRQEP